ncbi:MAG: hypothetical protein PF961_15280, partial [Planctomycetota bacterium]|jgi:hypothetical protein|nr:hypothetical protein [Planctomycetota bacterium]
VPAARLHVSGDGVFSRDIYVDKTYLANSGGGDASHRLDGFEDKLFVVAEPGVTSGAGIVLRTGEAGGVALDRLTVTPDGQFGFGIQSPLARLHVNGGGIFTSNVELDKLILANSTGGDAVHRVDGYADTLYVVASPGQTSDGSIVLRTGEAGGLERDRVTVAPNGRVGLGIGSAGALAQLTVAVEGTTAGTAGVQANGVLITRNTSCGLNLHTPSDRQGQINFGDPENRKAGAIIYDHADDSLTLESTGILRLKAPVEATGSVGLLQDLTVGGEFTLGDGPSIAAISADPEMNTPNDQTLPTQAAVKSYVDSALSSGVVHVDARTAAGQVIQSTSTRINFDEVYRDTHEAVTTGGGWSFVAPLSGLYVVHLGIHPNSSSMAVDLWTNGAANRRIAQSNGTYMVVGSCEIHMNAGDTLAIEGFASSQTSLVGSGFYNWITITGRP